jgi:hypothetical protein
MAKTKNNVVATVSKEQEQDKLAWTLVKADLQAVQLRLTALIQVGNEGSFDILATVIEDLNTATSRIAKNLSAWRHTAEPALESEGN